MNSYINRTFKTLQQTDFKILIVTAILLRIMVMPFYFHPDIKTYHFQSSFLKQGVFNIYSYLQDNKSSLPFKEEFVYFPLTYFFFGGYQIIVQPFLGDSFGSWLNDASQESSQESGVYRYLFVLKIPYLFFDIAIAFLLGYFFQKEEHKKRAFVFWLFNPISIILIYTFSNIDIIVVFFTLLSLLFAQRGKMIPAALLLGIGAGFKAYPLLFIPFLFLFGRGVKQKMQILFASFVPFMLTVGPFLQSASFRESTLASGLMTRLTLLGLSLGFGEILMLGVAVLSAVFFWGLLQEHSDKNILWKYYLSLLLIIFSFIHIHIQWLLWLLPFALIAVVSQRRVSPVIITLVGLAFFIPLLYEDKAMTVGLLSLISPLYNLVPVPFTIIQKVYDPYIVQGVLHSFFAGGSFVFIWRLFRERQA